MADAIRRFKYGDRSDLDRYLAPWLVEAALGYAGAVDAVVPVPLHWSKLRQRGWNPAALLARPVARALGVPLHTAWLRRVRGTPAQAGLSRSARQRNVCGAFQCSVMAASRPEAEPSASAPLVRRRRTSVTRVLLIDDVRTTGATLQEASQCLEAAGFEVSRLALAWAPDELEAGV